MATEDMGDTKAETPEVETKKALAGYIAFVEFFAGPGEPRNVGVQLANTKRELQVKLADPLVSQIFMIVRGRSLDFMQTRKITF